MSIEYDIEKGVYIDTDIGEEITTSHEELWEYMRTNNKNKIEHSPETIELVKQGIEEAKQGLGKPLSFNLDEDN